MKRTLKTFVLILFPLLFLTSFSVFFSALSQITKKYSKFAHKYHVQKIFLHTDKSVYQVGEHVWFKIYLMNDSLHLDTFSNTVFVELISPEKKIIDVRIIKLHNGIGWGDFLLNDSLFSGTYLLRAYTNFMKNFGENFFFKKIITVNNPKNNLIPEDVYLQIKFLEHKKRKILVSYNLNTGTNPICCLPNTVYIRTSNMLSNPVQTYVQLIENRKIIKQAKSDSLGLAKITFIPKLNAKYKLKIFRKHYSTVKIKLPPPKEFGYALNLNDSVNTIIATVFAHLLPNKLDKIYRTIYLIAERNGKIYFKTSALIDSIFTFKINKVALPSGIIHFVLFNGYAKPVADQIFFTRQVKYITPQLKLKKLNKNVFNLEISTNKKINASLSIAIISTDNHMSQTIYQYLSLKADIPHACPQILKYKHPNSLINAYKWLRYSPYFIWSNAQIPDPLFKPQKSLVIKGKITKLFLDLPVRGTKVTLSILNSYNDQFTTFTDNNGQYQFSGLNYPDTIVALVQARALNGSKNVLVYIDKYDTIPPSNFQPISSYKYKLDFFKLKPPKIKQWQNPGNALYSQVDQVIYMKDIQAPNNATVFDILQGRVPGFIKQGNKVYFRGISSITQNYEPLFLIDNTPVDKSTVESLNLDDIDRIEIIQNKAYSAIYGSRGANGIIAIYTKQGHKIISGHWQTTLPGYYTPKHFVPLPDSLLYSRNFVTFYWNPNLTLKNGHASTHFHLPSKIKSFKIIIQSVSFNGKIIYLNKSF